MVVEFTEEQNRALEAVVQWYVHGRGEQPYLTLGGYAGTGKTTVMGALPELLGDTLTPKPKPLPPAVNPKVCALCNAPLTTEVSINRGLGAECFRHVADMIKRRQDHDFNRAVNLVDSIQDEVFCSSVLRDDIDRGDVRLIYTLVWFIALCRAGRPQAERSTATALEALRAFGYGELAAELDGKLPRLFAPQSSIAFCTPTGKAAEVLRRKLADAGTGYASCGTIHSLIYKPVTNEKGEVTGWTRKEDLNCRLIVVDECFDARQPIFTEHGWLPIGKIVHAEMPIKVWACDAFGRLTLKPIARWLKRQSPPSMLQIRAGASASMRAGRTIRCTPSHKIKTPTGYVAARDLRVGDAVIARGRTMTPIQRSIMIGSLFGDGSINQPGKARNSPQMKFMNGEAQIEYLRFKQRIFNDLASKFSAQASGYDNGKPVYSFAIAVLDEHWRIVEQMLPDGEHPSGRRRWAPDNNLLLSVDEQTLTTWFLDNGSITARKLSDNGSNAGTSSYYATLHIQRFSMATAKRIAAFFAARFGLVGTVSSDAKGPWIRFSKQQTATLLSMIHPFVPECMKHKCPGFVCRYDPTEQIASDTCLARIRSIESVTPVSKFVYDLEIKDLHNYVAGNIVVSNCSMVSQDVWNDLRSFRIPILAVGDHGQLPPVGSSLNLVANPMLRLEQVHRQAQDNPIIALATAVRLGQPIGSVPVDPQRIWYGNGRAALSSLALTMVRGGFGLEQVILCHRNRTRVEINKEIRLMLGRREALPEVGDLVIGLRNSKAGDTRLWNGQRGVVTRLFNSIGDKLYGPDGTTVTRPVFTTGLEMRHGPGQADTLVLQANRLQFGRSETFKTIDEYANEARISPKAEKLAHFAQLGALMDFGYCCTTHKFQGSEAEDVAVVMEKSLDKSGDVADFKSRWAYTAITRARSRVCIIWL